MACKCAACGWGQDGRAEILDGDNHDDNGVGQGRVASMRESRRRKIRLRCCSYAARVYQRYHQTKGKGAAKSGFNTIFLALDTIYPTIHHPPSLHKLVFSRHSLNARHRRRILYIDTLSGTRASRRGTGWMCTGRMCTGRMRTGRMRTPSSLPLSR